MENGKNEEPARYLGELFDRHGIPYHRHFLDELEQKSHRGITEQKALDAYLRGTAYFDRDQQSIIFRSAAGIVIVVDPVTGWIRTVFEGSRQGVEQRWVWLGTAREFRRDRGWPPT